MIREEPYPGLNCKGIIWKQISLRTFVKVLHGCRGFTYLEKVQGRGSKTGDPHFGSHAWPSMCSAILTVVEDNKVDSLLDTLHKMDLQTEQLGLRAFVWNIERTI